jgi:hypothetical protein
MIPKPPDEDNKSTDPDPDVNSLSEWVGNGVLQDVPVHILEAAIKHATGHHAASRIWHFEVADGDGL